MDFWRAADILNKRKWLILFSVMIATALTFGATRLIGSDWGATIRFMAMSPAPAGDSPSGGSQAEDSEEFLGSVQGSAIVSANQADIYDTLVKSQAVLVPSLLAVDHKEITREAAEVAQKNISFRSVAPGLFELEVESKNPTRTAELANSLADRFMGEVQSLFVDQREKTIGFLQRELEDTNSKLATAQSQYNAFRAQHRILGDQTNDLAVSLDRLVEINKQRDVLKANLADVQAHLKANEAILDPLPAQVATQRKVAPNPLIAGLQTDLAQAERTLTELQSRYTDKVLAVQVELAKRDALKTRLNAELAKQPRSTVMIPNPDRKKYEETEHQLQGDQAADQAQLSELNSELSSAQVNIRNNGSASGSLSGLANEIARQSEMQANLASRLQIAQASLDKAKSQNPIVQIGKVDEANPPLNLRAGRSFRLTLLVALCTLMAMCGLVITFESLDRRAKSLSEMSQLLPAPICAAIPQQLGEANSQTQARITELQPLSVSSEAYHFLGMQILTEGRQNSKEPLRSIMVTSARASQGNTHTATNLAITLAQAGYRVIVVDANLRFPQIHERFGLPNELGLSDLLQRPEQGTLSQMLHGTSVENLQVLTSGMLSDNHWALLRSTTLQRIMMQLETLADFVVYDTPPATTFTDAMNLAPYVDGALFCVRAMDSPNGMEERMMDLLKQSNPSLRYLGIVLNDVPLLMLQNVGDHQQYSEGSKLSSAPRSLTSGNIVDKSQVSIDL